MDFISKVEAAYQVVEADITVPLKPIKLNFKQAEPKSKKAKAPRSPSTVDPKFAEGEQGGEKVGFADLTQTRKLTDFIKQELQLTDPFNFTNETWTRFTKKVAPPLLVALLLDMRVVPKARRAEFTRYLTRRLRTLSQT